MNATERYTAKEYLAMVAPKPAAATKRKNKYGNRRGIELNGEKYDSGKELKHHQALELARAAARDADRVIRIRRQVPFVLIEKQEEERAVKYVADFVVDYADGRSEVQDTKSPPTRAERTYILKRKLMLKVFGIRIHEF